MAITRDDAWQRPAAIPRTGSRLAVFVAVLTLVLCGAGIALAAAEGERGIEPGVLGIVLAVMVGTLALTLGLAWLIVRKVTASRRRAMEELAEVLGARVIPMGLGEHGLVLEHPLGHVLLDLRAIAKSRYSADRYTRIAIVGDELAVAGLVPRKRIAVCDGDLAGVDAAWRPLLQPFLERFGRLRLHLRPKRRLFDIGPSAELWVFGWIADAAGMQQLLDAGLPCLEAILGVDA
ncbi:MAG: hypothetical protein IPM29_30180 [Planctomycetes bacterium]|nr:hypothetical protein [Planctomycetota bacterium]